MKSSSKAKAAEKERQSNEVSSKEKSSKHSKSQSLRLQEPGDLENAPEQMQLDDE
jgi:hypothetical protein